MTAKTLFASPVVDEIKKDLINRCNNLKRKGVTPSMCVVLVGDNPASLTYIKNKKKMCEEIGAEFKLEHLVKNISPNDFLSKIDELNKNPSIHGIIIQLPVSDELKQLDIPNLIDPSKDIDGFNGINTQKIYSGTKDLSLLLPCTPKGIINLMKYYGIELSGKNVVVAGRSLIVGKPLSMLLSNFDATVTLVHSKTKGIEDFTRRADILICAIGKAHFFNKNFFDPQKKTTIIDVGMNILNGKITGDVNQDDIKEVAGAISPVPGGVGPMTVITLIQNLIYATEQKFKGLI